MTVLSLLPFPPLLWWKEALQNPQAVLDSREPFRKMGLKNRYRLASSNGPLWLTIPILGGREQRKPVGDIAIDNRLPWQKNHWRSIVSIYRRTPFFEHYEPGLQSFFEKPYHSLAAFNSDSIAWCQKALHTSVVFEKADYLLPDEMLLDRRERWLSFEGFPENAYAQPFAGRTGFLKGMSVLDALCCEGPATAALIQ